MNLKFITLALSASLLTFSFAQADVYKIESDYNKCYDAAESTADYNDCAGIALRLADQELNIVYSEIRTSLVKANDADSKETMARLTKAQRAWIVFRDANCSLVGTQMLGGSGESNLISSCLATATIERVKELNTIFTRH